MSLSRRVKQESLLNNSTGSVTVGASQTDIPVSQAFTIYDPVHLRVDLRLTAVTNGNQVTVKLQVSPGNDAATGGNAIWIDSKSITVGSFTGPVEYRSILLLGEHTGDQQYLPLPGAARIVVTTGGGASVTVDRVAVLS